ncbi:hypothetical protein B0H14DRAFT_3164167, partial [Mycena olivaceomarginata]
MPACPGSFEAYHQRDGQLCVPGCHQPILQRRGLYEQGHHQLAASAYSVYAARIPRPAGLALHWFEIESAALSEGSLYVKLIRAVYELANSTSTNPLPTVGLLAEIFSYLKDDALAFLTGVWTTSRDSTPDLCLLALRHAAAFLEAHNKEADGVVLPALSSLMGSNVFHRDDSYSFKVVQKTIDNILPVMISSFNMLTRRVWIFTLHPETSFVSSRIFRSHTASPSHEV